MGWVTVMYRAIPARGAVRRLHIEGCHALQGDLGMLSAIARRMTALKALLKPPSRHLAFRRCGMRGASLSLRRRTGERSSRERRRRGHAGINSCPLEAVRALRHEAEDGQQQDR